MSFNSTAARTKAAVILQGIRHIQLSVCPFTRYIFSPPSPTLFLGLMSFSQLVNRAAIERSVSFMEQYQSTIHASKKQDIKSVLLETLVVILRPLVKVRPPLYSFSCVLSCGLHLLSLLLYPIQNLTHRRLREQRSPNWVVGAHWCT
jgi:hypothetical protein